MIAVLGDVLADVVVHLDAPVARGSDTPARIVHRGGGSAANVAAWLARAGARAVLFGRVGDDVAGHGLLADLRDAGVDVRIDVDPDRPTGTCVVLVEPGGERSMLPDRGASAALAPIELPPEAKHLHVAGYALLDPGARPAAMAAIAAARTAGIPVSVDPASAAPLAAAGASAFLAWAEGATLYLPNHDEATVLTNATDPTAAARTLARRAGEAVVTLGEDGAVWSDGDELRRVDARTTTVLDTTGAGDAFTAGLLAARMSAADPRRALEAGTALAAEAVARTGAR